MAFLPLDYEAPPKQGGHYFKPEDGENRIRIVGSAVVGWIGWDKSGDKPQPIRVGMNEGDRERIAHLNSADDRISHFWAFPVVDRLDGEIKIWEVTQATVRDAIQGLVNDTDWGHPGEYDIVVSKTGAKKDTSYTVIPKPKSPADLTDRQKEVLHYLVVKELLTGGQSLREGGLFGKR